MLIIKDLLGDEAPLLKHSEVAITEELLSVGSLKTTIYRTKDSEIGFDMISELALITEPKTGQMYRVVQRSGSRTAQTPFLTITCLHVLNDLKRKWVYDSIQNTQSIQACMNLIVSGTAFTYTVHDSFDGVWFESFGKARATDLFLNKVVSQFNCEFYVDNYHIHIYKKIGKENSFVFFDGASVSKLRNEYDDTTITTRIRGEGKLDDNGIPIVKTEYISPNASTYGVIDADFFSDERFTVQSAIDAEAKSRIQDYPLMQITAEFNEFKKGSPLSTINDVSLGNSGYVKDRYGLDIYTRITGLTHFPQNQDKQPVLTFGNVKGSLSKTLASLKNGQRNSQSILSNIGATVVSNIPSSIKTASNKVMTASEAVGFTEGGIITNSSFLAKSTDELRFGDGSLFINEESAINKDGINADYFYNTENFISTLPNQTLATPFRDGLLAKEDKAKLDLISVTSLTDLDQMRRDIEDLKGGVR